MTEREIHQQVFLTRNRHRFDLFRTEEAGNRFVYPAPRANQTVQRQRIRTLLGDRQAPKLQSPASVGIDLRPAPFNHRGNRVADGFPAQQTPFPLDLLGRQKKLLLVHRIWERQADPWRDWHPRDVERLLHIRPELILREVLLERVPLVADSVAVDMNWGWCAAQAAWLEGRQSPALNSRSTRPPIGTPAPAR